ncbi:phosphotransferase [Paractinoplanes globisporus]|uniref:Phosphotransferase n=1 Tax=Paractinoplanes globisporus TaxID=113565 RepID=A0ABW6WND2_9ACTN|nr:phosphotransferase [Actinoplanes globisporus]
MESAQRVADSFGLGRVLACRQLTDGVMNLTWCLTTDAGIFAVKQLRDRSPEEVRVAHDLLPRLAALGFPVPAPVGGPVRVDGPWYAASTWLNGVHPQGFDLTLAGATTLGDLVARLHVALSDVCPPAKRRLPDIPDRAGPAISLLERYAGRPPADEFDRHAVDEIAWRREHLARLADRRPADADVEPCGWTHGDLQPFNLLIDPGDGRITGILDWDRLGVRPYGLEVVRTATITFGRDLDRIAAFARGYRARIPITDDRLADAAHRRWWTLLTETWQLERHYEHGDRSCDHLFTRRGEYLRWWTDHRAEIEVALRGG